MEKIHKIFDIFEKMSEWERKLRLDSLNDLYGNKSKKTNDWISVKDKLPEEGKRILAYAKKDENSDFPYLDSSYFEADQYGGLFYENVDGCRINVTHWMPLSTPPKDE